MRKIKVWTDPYGMGFDTCIKKEIEIKPGLTVLVGGNGSGKTTLLKNIKEELDAAVVPVSGYNDLSDGRHNGLGNEYELASGEQCFDVIKGEYVTFDNYEEYKELILRTRKDKEKRYDKLAEANNKKGRKKE